MHKCLDHSTLINLPNTNRCLGQSFLADKEQFITRMEVQNSHQRLAVMAGLLEA